MDPEHDRTRKTVARKILARGNRVFLRYACKRLGAFRIAWSADVHFQILTARGVRDSKARDQVLMLLAEQSSACEFDGTSANRTRPSIDVRSACRLQQDRIRELDRILLAELLPAERQPAAQRFVSVGKAVAVAVVVSVLTAVVATSPHIETPPHADDRHQR